MGLLDEGEILFPALAYSPPIDLILDNGLSEMMIAIIKEDRDVVVELGRQDMVGILIYLRQHSHGMDYLQLIFKIVNLV